MRASRLAAGAILAGAGWCGPGAAAHCPPLARGLDVPLHAEGLAGVAITFDDGPDPFGTPLILETLAERGARATFFLVGEQVRRHPALVGELVAAGHEPAVHGYRHRNQMRLGPHRCAEDLRRAVAAIAEAAGRAPTYHRPPYGAFTLAGLHAVRREGLEPMLWSRWGGDWRGDTPAAEIAARVVGDGLCRGDVVLLHDADRYCSPHAYRNTAAALPRILDAAGAGGLAALALPADAAARGARHSSRPL